MFKVISVLIFAVINITQLSIFEIEGVFSNAHVNSVERYFSENKSNSNDLFVVQYNATDSTEKAIEDFTNLLNSQNNYKAIWVGPNKTTIDYNLIKSFDFVGISPGTVISNYFEDNFIEGVCNLNTCTSNTLTITAQEGVYKDYLIVGTLGAFLEKLGSETIISNLDNETNLTFKLETDEVQVIKFNKPSLAERFYIAIANPLFSYLFFALGFSLIGLELFAIGPGLMAFIGALLIGLSSMVFSEFGLNYYGLILFAISFFMFIKVLSRGFFGYLGLVALFFLHSSAIVMYSNYSINVNSWLLLLASAVIAFFYFIAIPTVIRSRLTTDTNGMGSFEGKNVQLIEKIYDSKGIVEYNNNRFVVELASVDDHKINETYQIKEIEGKLSI